jgi:hypothetical protein
MVSVNFVQADFFVNRIREFETKYQMPWEQFMAQYTTGKLPRGCQETDFTEWAFLCNNFMEELLKPLGAGPPPEQENAAEVKEPEVISGSFILGDAVGPSLCQVGRHRTMVCPPLDHGRH